MTENEQKLFDNLMEHNSAYYGYELSKGEIKTVLQAFEQLKQYRAIGTVEQLRTMFDGYWKLKDLCEEYEKYGLPEDYWKLNEICKEYSAIGTVGEFKALKENDVAKELVEHNFQDEVHHYLCPSCRSIVSCTQNYCEECRQALET